MSLFNTIIIAIALVAFGSATDAIDSADVGLNANLILADSVITSSVCNKGFVDCRDGFEVIDGETTTRTCHDACGGSGGSCCVDGNGLDACDNFSGLVCKDGSCSNGGNACKGASIELVINSCIGVEACMNASIERVIDSCNGRKACTDANIGSVVNSCVGNNSCGSIGEYSHAGIDLIRNSCNGRQACKYAAANGGSIDSIDDSCHGVMACEYAAANGGSIDTIENSCNNGNYNCYQLARGGSIGHIISSCSGIAAALVDDACTDVGQGEPIDDILSCCNGEDEVCCQSSACSVTVTTLPEACASDPTVGIRGFARRFADE